MMKYIKEQNLLLNLKIDIKKLKYIDFKISKLI